MKINIQKIIVCLLVCLSVFLGCEQQNTSRSSAGNAYIGNMNDTSYSGQTTPDKKIFRVNGNGRNVCVDELEGYFVWADYSATWCKPCVSQARAVKQVEKKYSDEAVFLTVITSKGTGHKNPFRGL